MTQAAPVMDSSSMDMHGHSSGVLVRTFVIGLTAFLTVVDLFATQAILPTLARAYHVTPAAMGLAVNASTVGMAIAGLAVAFFSRRINRRAGILLSLAFLAVPSSLLAYWGEHLRNGPLRASFGIGFLILFTFIGTFTYVNFVLVRQPLDLSPMQLGFVYLVFLPSILTTPLAGKVAQRFGTRPTFWGSLAVAGAGLPLLLTPSLAAVLVGLALIGVGTFFAQAAATGFVSRAATGDRG